jgi:hypothetical protein
MTGTDLALYVVLALYLLGAAIALADPATTRDRLNRARRGFHRRRRNGGRP